MKTTITLCLTAGLLGWAAAASADVLELKNGQVLTGKYVGGTAGTIRFETGGGTQVIETGQALALTFSGGGATAWQALSPCCPRLNPDHEPRRTHGKPPSLSPGMSMRIGKPTTNIVFRWRPDWASPGLVASGTANQLPQTNQPS